MGATLIIAFLGAIAIGIPVAFALGIAGVLVFALVNPDLLALLPQRIFTGIDLFALIAVPFFILAGELMGGSGILQRILNFAQLVAGHIRGSVAQVTILVSMMFGWINGSGVAGASAVGSMLIPSMNETYKNKAYSAAVTACSSTIGPIIPPSVPMILYALIAENVSVAGMFAAGVIPGLLMALGMMAVTYVIARLRNYPSTHQKTTLGEKLKISRQFLVAAALPIIMVGGIVGGVFTPVEAGAIAVLYALAIGLFVTRTLSADLIYKALINTGVITSVVFLMMGVANFASWIITTERVPQAAADLIGLITTDPLMFLLLVNIILLIAGLFFDAVAAMVMFAPILVPMSESFGISPLHFGTIFVINLIIGLVTPPVGMCLFITAGIGRAPIESVFRESLPYLAWLLTVLMIVTYLPASYLWLPEMLGYR